MKRERDIVFEIGAHFVIRAPKGYEVYRQGLTHATRVAQIGQGYGGNRALDRAIQEAERREADDRTHWG